MFVNLVVMATYTIRNYSINWNSPVLLFNESIYDNVHTEEEN